MVGLCKSNICDRSMKSVIYTLIKSKNLFTRLNFSHNEFFRDYCLKQLADYLQEAPHVVGLQLEKINASDSAIIKFFSALPYIKLEELNISSNPMNYICFDQLSQVIRDNWLSLRSLDVSNTKLTDKNAIELFESIIKNSQITCLNMSRNQSIGFKFSSHAVQTLKFAGQFSLQFLDISYCGISHVNQKQLLQLVYQNACEQVHSKRQSSIHHFQIQTVINDEGRVVGKSRQSSIENKAQKSDKKQETVTLANSISKQNRPPLKHNFVNLLTSELSPQSPVRETPNKENIYYKETVVTMSPLSQEDNEQAPSAQVQSYNLRSHKSAFENDKQQKFTQLKTLSEARHQQKLQKPVSFYYPLAPTFTDEKSLVSNISTYYPTTTHSSVAKEPEAKQDIYQTTNSTRQNLLNKFKSPSIMNQQSTLTDSFSYNGSYKQARIQKRSQTNQSTPVDKQNVFQSFTNPHLTTTLDQRVSTHLSENTHNSQSPQRYSVYQTYYRDQRKKQKHQSNLSTQKTSFKNLKDLISESQVLKSRQHSENNLTPKIIQSRPRSAVKIESQPVKVKANLTVNEIVKQQQMKIDSLKTERYSQSMASLQQQRLSRKRNAASQQCSQKKIEQSKRNPSIIRSSSRNNFSSNISIDNTPNAAYQQNSTQRTVHSQRQAFGNAQSFTSTRPTSTLNTIRYFPQQIASQEQFQTLPSKDINMSQFDIGSRSQLSHSIQDVSQLRSMIKGEIERLQTIYQSIDTVLMSTGPDSHAKSFSNRGFNRLI